MTVAVIGGVFTILAALITVVGPIIQQGLLKPQPTSGIASAGGTPTPSPIATVTPEPTRLPTQAPQRPTATLATSAVTAALPTSTRAVPQMTPSPIPSPAAPATKPADEGARFSRLNPPVPAPLGWPHEKDGLQLSLVQASIYTDADSSSSAARLSFVVLNKSSQRVIVQFDRSQVYLTDSAGTRYNDWEGTGAESFSLEPGGSRSLNRYYSTTVRKQSRIPLSALPVTVHVAALSQVTGAQWVVSGTPVPTYKDGDTAGQVGSALAVSDFEVTLTSIQVQASADPGAAAVRAFFSVRNKSAQRRLLELDYIYIYVEDSFGIRYIDQYGPGLASVWVDAGKEYQFNRYYSTESSKQSRVPSGASYVVIISEGIGNGTRVQWRYNIVR
ncbi:MAG: hypothetical protein IT330_12655 [Anaerolineae bacterium]|nr:hypothetical protein [Anaerolineae bacterium]